VQTDTLIDPVVQGSLPANIQAKGPDDLGCPGQPKSHECIWAAQEAWKRLSSGQTRHDWMIIGKAFQFLRTEAMYSAHVNKPEGRRYNEEFSALLKANGFDGIDKATRSRLFAVLDHKPEIESWLATVPANKKLHLNHPHTVWRAYQRSLVKKPDGGKKPSQALEPGDSLFSRQDTAHDIAGVVYRTILSPSKAREIARELNRLARQTAEACV
jgi:hypothetical protein